MAESLNQQIADRLTQRQILALRIESGLRQQVLDALAILENDIVSMIKASDPTDFGLLTRRRREVQRLMDDEIDPAIRLRYEQIARMLDAAMMRLGRQEASMVQETVNDVVGETIVEDQPSDRQLRAGIVAGLFPSPARPVDFSAVGSEWWARQGQDLSQRIGDQLRVSVSLEES